MTKCTNIQWFLDYRLLNQGKMLEQFESNINCVFLKESIPEVRTLLMQILYNMDLLNKIGDKAM